MFPVPDKGGYRKFGYTLPDGRKHLGDDYNCPAGTKVKAIADGNVLWVGRMNGYGSLNPSTKGDVLFIRHTLPNGVDFVAQYGHTKSDLKVLDRVSKNDIIGEIIPFTNGGVSCNHLHFGIHLGGVMPKAPYGYSNDYNGWVNPTEFLKKEINT